MYVFHVIRVAYVMVRNVITNYNFIILDCNRIQLTPFRMCVIIYKYLMKTKIFPVKSPPGWFKSPGGIAQGSTVPPLLL